MTYSSTADPYATGSTQTVSPSRAAAAVTPSDTVDFTPTYAKRLYIGTTGDVAVIPVNNYALANTTPVIYHAVPAGTYLNIQVARVMATGTTASNITAEFH